MKSNPIDASVLGADNDGTQNDLASSNAYRNGGYVPQRPDSFVRDHGLPNSPYGRPSNISQLYNTTSNSNYGNWFCRGNDYSKTSLRTDATALVHNKEAYNYGKHAGMIGDARLNSDRAQQADNQRFISNCNLQSGRSLASGMYSRYAYPPSSANFRLSNYQQQQQHGQYPIHPYHQKHAPEARPCRSPSNSSAQYPQTACPRNNVQLPVDLDVFKQSFQKHQVPPRPRQFQSGRDLNGLGSCLSSVETVDHDTLQRAKINGSASLAQQKLHHLQQQQLQLPQESAKNVCSALGGQHLSGLIHGSANNLQCNDVARLNQVQPCDNPQQLTQVRPGVHSTVANKSSIGRKLGVISNAPLIPRRNGKPINAFLNHPRKIVNYENRSPTSCSSPGSGQARGHQHFSTGYSRQYTDSSRNQYPNTNATPVTASPDLKEYRQPLEGDMASPHLSPCLQEKYSEEDQRKPSFPQDVGDKQQQMPCSAAAPKRSILKNSTSRPQNFENPCEWSSLPFSASFKSGRRQSMSDLSFFRHHQNQGLSQAYYSRFIPEPTNAEATEATGGRCGTDACRSYCHQQPDERLNLLQGRNASDQKCASKGSLSRKKVSFLL